MQKKPTTPRTATRTTQAQTGTTVESQATRSEVAQALANGKAKLSPPEEKALRMRFGAGAPRTLVLERVGQEHPEAREKLLGIEVELLRQWRQRQSEAKKAAPATVTPASIESVSANPKRDRIVAALKTKKPAR